LATDSPSDPISRTPASRRSYGYQVPAQPDSPWPTFRRDHRNSGNSPLPAAYHGDQPWSFQTGKGIFSTPVLDGHGSIYFGSADHIFYALARQGSLQWEYRTGEIIDSAAALLDAERVGQPAVVLPSGDGFLRCLATLDGSLLWVFDARQAPRASYNNWFEGNVAVGPDGTLYAGNTNFNYYALSPDGNLSWTYPTGSNCWSNAAFGSDGTIFWGGCDARVRAVRPDGREKWSRRTLGFVAASAAIGSDGAVYIGSFDSHIYALDPETGRIRWKFKTGDHIYASAALSEGSDGRTTAIFVGSTDGVLYALDPAGRLQWSFDAGAPIRSSPVVGRMPPGQAGNLVYVGCGNGRLYAIHAVDGSFRWSFDTTPDQAELRDRNDLNGSPALGETGVYIGGEHGQLFYIPYDYPLHVPDPRGETSRGETGQATAATFCFLTPGGNRDRSATPLVCPATVLTFELLAPRAGARQRAHLHDSPLPRPGSALEVLAEPPFEFRLETSAGGRYFHLIPEDMLRSGFRYTLRLAARLYRGGLSIGNLTIGGRRCGKVSATLPLQVEAVPEDWPLVVGEDQVSAIEWTRLAVPIPTMLPSLNQIGFDYMDWIIGTVAVSAEGRCVLWAIGGRRNQEGTLVADPRSDFALPLSGRFRRSSFIVTNRRFSMKITGIPIPFDLFELRGTLGSDLSVGRGATAYAETRVLSIPTFGPLLVLAGLANRGWKKLVAKGTYLSRRYDPTGPANRRPAGVDLAGFSFTAPKRHRDGQASATFALQPGFEYPLEEHRPALLLLDGDRTEAVPLDYHANLSATADDRGQLTSASLCIPAGTRLPKNLQAAVMLDVFPLSLVNCTPNPETD